MSIGIRALFCFPMGTNRHFRESFAAYLRPCHEEIFLILSLLVWKLFLILPSLFGFFLHFFQALVLKPSSFFSVLVLELSSFFSPYLVAFFILFQYLFWVFFIFSPCWGSSFLFFRHLFWSLLQYFDSCYEVFFKISLLVLKLSPFFQVLVWVLSSFFSFLVSSLLRYFGCCSETSFLFSFLVFLPKQNFPHKKKPTSVDNACCICVVCVHGIISIFQF